MDLSIPYGASVALNAMRTRAEQLKVRGVAGYLLDNFRQVIQPVYEIIGGTEGLFYAGEHPTNRNKVITNYFGVVSMMLAEMYVSHKPTKIYSVDQMALFGESEVIGGLVSEFSQGFVLVAFYGEKEELCEEIAHAALTALGLKILI